MNEMPVKIGLIAGLSLALLLSACLKTIEVPFFQLTVQNGLGSGRYPAEASVSIVAEPPVGQRFLGWEGDTAYLDRPREPEARYRMPGRDALVAAYCLPVGEPSFRYEVFPIIQEYCAIEYCHKNSLKQPDFDSYESIAAAYDKMELYLELGFMPLAGTLPPEKKQILLDWLRQGRKNN